MKIIALLATLVYIAKADVEWEFVNNAQGPIWIGILGNNGKPPLANGGFVLNQGESTVITSDNYWAGRMWPRTWCDPNSQHCQTGDCGNKLECNGAGGVPPVTLAEFTLKGDQGQDFYDISLVDGYNIGMTIQPVGGTGDRCQTISCTGDINAVCPDYARLMDDNGNYVIGCKSDCMITNSDQDCCRGDYGPQNCQPSNTARIFKQQCPQAYSYAYDDATSTFACFNTQRYVITIVQ